MFGDYIVRKIKDYNGTKIILISTYDLDGELIRVRREQIHCGIHKELIQMADLIQIVACTTK
jgi:hypothetical protein